MKKVLMTFVVVFMILAVGLLGYMFTKISEDSRMASSNDNLNTSNSISDSANTNDLNNSNDINSYNSNTNLDSLDNNLDNMDTNLGNTITNFVNDILSSVDLSDVTTNVNYSGTNSSNGVFNVSGSKLVNTQTLSLNEITTLSIEYSFFDVTFYPSETNELVIMEYMNYTPSKNELAQITRSSNTLTIKTGRKDNFSTTILPGNNKVDIYLPASFNGSIKTATSSGNISSDLDLNLDKFILASSSGNISFGAITTKNIIIATTSGNVNVDTLSGGGNIVTTSGNITLNLSDNLDSLINNIGLTASSGNINLNVPSNLSFNFKGKTSSGNIQTSFDKELTYNKQRNNATGTVGSKPSIDVEITATSGNVYVD